MLCVHVVHVHADPVQTPVSLSLDKNRLHVHVCWITESMLMVEKRKMLKIEGMRRCVEMGLLATSGMR